MGLLQLSEKEKTSTRSFRTSESAFKTVGQDAVGKIVSVITLVNELFLSYTGLDRFFDKINGIQKINSSEHSSLIEF